VFDVQTQHLLRLRWFAEKGIGGYDAAAKKIFFHMYRERGISKKKPQQDRNLWRRKDSKQTSRLAKGIRMWIPIPCLGMRIRRASLHRYGRVRCNSITYWDDSACTNKAVYEHEKNDKQEPTPHGKLCQLFPG
jgi:hypothetical protein